MFNEKEWKSIKMLRFVNHIFVSAMMFCGCNVSDVNSLNTVPLNTVLKCISINNQKCKIRPEMINFNSNEPLFYPYSIKVINAVAVVIVLKIYIQSYAFLMLKT